AEGSHRHAMGWHGELRHELAFHRIGVHEHVMAEPILNAKRAPIEPAVPAVARRSVHVVHCKNDALSNHPVVGHQEGAVEDLEFVVPENVKKWCARAGRVLKQSSVIQQDAPRLRGKGRVFALAPANIKESEVAKGAPLWTVQLVAANEAEAKTLRCQRKSQSEGIRLVAPASEQPNVGRRP